MTQTKKVTFQRWKVTPNCWKVTTGQILTVEKWPWVTFQRWKMTGQVIFQWGQFVTLHRPKWSFKADKRIWSVPLANILKWISDNKAGPVTEAVHTLHKLFELDTEFHLYRMREATWNIWSGFSMLQGNAYSFRHMVLFPFWNFHSLILRQFSTNLLWFSRPCYVEYPSVHSRLLLIGIVKGPTLSPAYIQFGQTALTGNELSIIITRDCLQSGQQCDKDSILKIVTSTDAQIGIQTKGFLSPFLRKRRRQELPKLNKLMIIEKSFGYNNNLH